MTAIQVFASGDRGGHELTAGEVGLARADFHSTAGVLSIPLRIEPSQLPADHYSGTLHITVENLDDPVTVPIDFTVRNEPLFAILALIAGILLGRLGKRLQSAPPHHGRR